MAYSSTYVESTKPVNRNNFLRWFANGGESFTELPSKYKACGQYSIPTFARLNPFGFCLNLDVPETSATFANLRISAVSESLGLISDNFMTLSQDTTPTTGYRVWGYTSSLNVSTSVDSIKYFVIYDNVSGNIIWRSSEIRIDTDSNLSSEGYVSLKYRNSIDRFGFSYETAIAAESDFYNIVYLKMHHLNNESVGELQTYREVTTGNIIRYGTNLNQVLVMRSDKWDRKFHEAANIALGASDEIYLNNKRYSFDADSGYDSNQNENSDFSLSNFRLYEYDYALTDKS